MRMVKLAKSHLAQAEARVEAAKGAFRDGNHPFTLRLCQEAVEMGLKASLRLVGVEYPKKHDVSGILIDVGDRFPEWFRDQIPFLVDIKSPERKPPTSVAGLARLYKKREQNIFGCGWNVQNLEKGFHPRWDEKVRACSS